MGVFQGIVFGLFCKRLVDSAELKLCRTGRFSHSIDFNHTWPPGVADTDGIHERAIMGAKSITEESSCSSSTFRHCDVICRHHQFHRSRQCWILSNFPSLWQNCCSVENKLLLDKVQPSSQMWLVRPFRSVKSSIHVGVVLRVTCKEQHTSRFQRHWCYTLSICSKGFPNPELRWLNSICIFCWGIYRWATRQSGFNHFTMKSVLQLEDFLEAATKERCW